MNIYVGNLSYTATEEEVKELFDRFGEVQTVKLINDKATGRPRGFGFVEMEDEAGKTAIETLNGTDHKGRSIQVNEARVKEQSDRPPRSRNY